MTTYLAACSIENFWEILSVTLVISIVAATISVRRDAKRIIAESERLRKERIEMMSELKAFMMEDEA